MSWDTVQLKEVATVSAGNSAPQADELFKDGRHNFYRTSDVGKIRKGVISNSLDKLNDEGIKGLKEFGVGTILFPKSGASTFLNHRVMLEKEGYVSSHLAAIKAKNEVLNDKYLFYFLITIDAKNLVQDSNYPSLKTTSIEKINIQIPPLEIQKKIVVKLNAFFGAVEAAVIATEANLKNTEALFQSYLREIFTDSNSEMVKLSSLTNEISDGDHQPPPKSSTGVPFITISNIHKATRERDFTDTFRVSRDYYDNLKVNRKPTRGDVLYTVTGSFGIPIHIDTDDEFCFQRHIGLIRPSNKVESRWLYWVMSSPQVFQQAKDSATGAAQLTVSLKALRNFVVPFMPLDKQRNVVNRIEELYKETKSLADSYREKGNELKILKSSVLKKAFNTELAKDWI